MSSINFFIDSLFPRRCLGCGKWGQYFCPSCLKKKELLDQQICPVCQKPAILGKTHPDCQAKYSLDGLTSIFSYEGLIRKAITKLKYRFVTDLAEELIDLTIAHLRLPTRKPITLIPVPLHPRRKRWRGFNQAELLGEILAKKWGGEVRKDILIRQKHTKPQTKLKIKERRKNVQGVFALSKNRPPLRLILFDDVWTTGSTLKECGLVLKRNGTKFIWGLTLAR